MKSFCQYIGLLACLFGMAACSKIDSQFTTKSAANKMTTLLVRFADGSGGFSPVQTEPYGDSITIEIPWYYPAGTYNETSLDSLFISATLPNSAIMTPSFGLTDFSRTREYVLTAQDGTQQRYLINVVRKKSSAAAIESFKLNEADVNGVIVKDTVVIPYSGGDLSSQTATVSLSYYASIAPDPSTARDYTQPVEYTVTADDGTTRKFVVVIGTPTKVAKGISTVKKLWTKSPGDLGFTDYRQISIAVSGDYFLLPTSNEWASGSEIKYYNRKTGNFSGNLNTTGVDRIFSIAADAKGKVLGINSLYAGMNVSLYEWDNVTAAPKLFARTSDWSSVAGAFYGRKLSIAGDLDDDAVIMATTDGSSAGGANNVLKWVVKDGTLLSPDPEVITIPVAFSYVAKATPTGVNATDDYYFCSSYPSFIDYRRGTNNARQYAFSPGFITNPRGSTPALTYFEFNNAKFAAIVDAGAYSSAMHIFDVTDPSQITTSAGDANYAAFHVFDGSADYLACPSANWNVTAEIATGPVSADGFTMTVYFLVTNGGVAAYELSCVAQ